MAPLPADSTARYKVFYTNGGKQHTQTVRVNAVSPSAFGTAFGALMAAIAGDLTVTSIDSVEFAGTGSSIFLPVTSGIEGTSFGGEAADLRTVAQFADFIGRSAGGKRVRAAIFGIKSISLDNRFVAGESAAFDNARAVLVANPTMWIGIDGQPTAWKTYINSGFNAHWQRAVRP